MHTNFLANPITPQEEHLLSKLLTLNYFCLVGEFIPTVSTLNGL